MKKETIRRNLIKYKQYCDNTSNEFYLHSRRCKAELDRTYMVFAYVLLFSIAASRYKLNKNIY